MLDIPKLEMIHSVIIWFLRWTLENNLTNESTEDSPHVYWKDDSNSR